MIDKSRFEVYAVIVICLIIFALSVYFDLARMFFGLSLRYQYLQFGELFIFLLIVGCGIGYLGMRQMVALHREVAERKRMEAALKESEQYATALFKTMQTGMVVIDRQTCEILDVNPAAREMRSEWIGKRSSAANATITSAPIVWGSALSPIRASSSTARSGSC